MKIELMHLVGDREGRAIARVQHRLPGVETTEVEAHMATVLLVCYKSSAAACPQAVHDGG